MKKMLANILLLGLLLSMAAAKNDAKRAPANTASKIQDFDGWVSDDKCGANINAECSKRCQAHGAKMVFVTADKTVIPVANQDSVKSLAGQHVNIKGKLENGILTVDSVKALAK